jgi:hypothetical protein
MGRPPGSSKKIKGKISKIKYLYLGKVEGCKGANFLAGYQ